MTVEPVYICASYMSSLSTAFMAGCEAGGMPTLYADENREMAFCDACRRAWSAKRYAGTLRTVFGDEVPMLPDCGTPACRTMFGNHVDCYRGTAVKAVLALDRLPAIPGYEYSVVFLVRDYEEIDQSLEARFGCCAARPGHRAYYERMLRLIAQWPDATKHVVWARDLTKVRTWANLGWPLDPVAAAEAIDPERIRFRIEDLDVGILDRSVKIA